MEKKKLAKELHEKSGIPLEILEKNDKIFELINACYNNDISSEERKKVMDQIAEIMKKK